MNTAPVSMRRLLMPLNSAMPRKARRQALSAAASSELTGCGRAGRGSWLIKVPNTVPHSYHDRTYKLTSVRRRIGTWLQRCHDAPQVAGHQQINDSRAVFRFEAPDKPAAGSF